MLTQASMAGPFPLHGKVYVLMFIVEKTIDANLSLTSSYLSESPMPNQGKAQSEIAPPFTVTPTRMNTVPTGVDCPFRGFASSEEVFQGFVFRRLSFAVTS